MSKIDFLPLTILSFLTTTTNALPTPHMHKFAKRDFLSTNMIIAVWVLFSVGGLALMTFTILRSSRRRHQEALDACWKMYGRKDPGNDYYGPGIHGEPYTKPARATKEDLEKCWKEYRREFKGYLASLPRAGGEIRMDS